MLVQGAGGGVATALIALGRAAGLRVLATSRDESKRAKALELGAHEVFESGERLPAKVDAVMETVGRATWTHSIRSLRPGGTDRHLRDHLGAEARRRDADQHLLPAAQRHRLDDGHPRRAGGAGHACSTRPASARCSTARCRWSEAREGFAAMAERRRLRQDRPHPLRPASAVTPARESKKCLAHRRWDREAWVQWRVAARAMKNFSRRVSKWASPVRGLHERRTRRRRRLPHPDEDRTPR